MKPNIYDRIDVLEDELQGLDSRHDAQMRKLWTEILDLRAMLAEVQEWMRQEVKSCRR